MNIKDTNMEVGLGFMLIALKMNPVLIQGILDPDENKEALRSALLHLGYLEQAADLVINHPRKLLWPYLLKFFEGKSSSTIYECIMIISKMEILKDPGD